MTKLNYFYLDDFLKDNPSADGTSWCVGLLYFRYSNLKKGAYGLKSFLDTETYWEKGEKECFLKLIENIKEIK